MINMDKVSKKKEYAAEAFYAGVLTPRDTDMLDAVKLLKEKGYLEYMNDDSLA